MKTKFAFLLLLFCKSIIPIFGQCIAEAGRDKIICRKVNGIQSKEIGGNPSASGGKAPYTYKWETYYVLTIGNHTYIKTGSYFLNDTTLANPTIIQSAEKTLTFTLTVTDADGKVCIDSTKIGFSFEMIRPANFTAIIKEGDTVELDLGTNIGSNLPIVSYLWRPNDGLIDSTNLKLVAAPKKATNYYLTVTDSAGCVYTGSPYYWISISPLGMDEKKVDPIQISLFPNPSKEFVNIKIETKSTDNLRLELFDMQGKLIYQQETTSNLVGLKTDLFPKGTILYKISSAQKVVGQGKLIIE